MSVTIWFDMYYVTMQLHAVTGRPDSIWMIFEFFLRDYKECAVQQGMLRQVDLFGLASCCIECLGVIYSYFEKGCQAKCACANPEGNMGYDQYTVPNDCSCRTYFCCFSLALANICPWPLVPFFQISSENRADKNTHNTFQDCRVHFFRQPFSKQLYQACDAVFHYQIS